MLARVEKFLIKKVNSKPGLLSYLVMLVSFATGIFFGLFWFSDSVHETFIYQKNVLHSPQIWGGLLLAGSTFVLYGLYRKSKNFVRLGAMINFIMWFFAAIAYGVAGLWVAFVTIAAFHLLVQAHFYLAASLDTLFRKR